MALVEAIGVGEPGRRACAAIALLAGRVPDVYDESFGREPDLPTVRVGAVAPLQVLDVHEKRLVESADLVERVAADQQRGADRPVDRSLPVVGPRTVQR